MLIFVMARTKEFNPDEALERALELFHKKGYASTSIQDLVEVMGIGRGSLYETFGSKEELFTRALNRYADRSYEMMLACINDAPDPVSGIRALIEKMADMHADNPDRSGCMVVNTIIELAPHHPDFVETFRRVWGRLEDLLEETLARAQEEGQIGSGKSPRALARFLSGTVQALAVRGKYDPDREGIHDITEMALAAIG